MKELQSPKGCHATVFKVFCISTISFNLHNSPIRKIVLFSAFYNLENNDSKRLIKLSKVIPLLSGRGERGQKPPHLVPRVPTSQNLLLDISNWSPTHEQVSAIKQNKATLTP